MYAREKSPYASPFLRLNGAMVRPSFDCCGCVSRIVPNCASYFLMLSCKASIRRLACSGAMMTRLFTCAFGMPGII